MPRAYTLLRAFSLAGGLTLLASPAQAQFGKLKKIGADAIKDKAKDKLTSKKDSVATTATKSGASAESGATTKPVDLSLTDDRVALVVASLQPMVADAQKRQELALVTKSHTTKVAASRACMDALAKSFNPMSALTLPAKTSAELERLSKQSSAVLNRLQAAAERGDTRARIFLQDTVAVLQQRSAMLSMRGTCVIDFTPPPILEAQVVQMTREVVTSNPDAGSFSPPSVVKELLTPQQYGIIRERIALWALQQADPTLKGGKEGIFTAEEQAALTAHASEIAKLTPWFKGGWLRWSTWDDLASW